jgi:two-component system, oxyanion-binding sensor
LLRALHHSARWCQDLANHGEQAAVMAQPRFLDLPPAVQAANFPWKSMRCGSTRR